MHRRSFTRRREQQLDKTHRVIYRERIECIPRHPYSITLPLTTIRSSVVKEKAFITSKVLRRKNKGSPFASCCYLMSLPLSHTSYSGGNQ